MEILLLILIDQSTAGTIYVAGNKTKVLSFNLIRI